MKSSRLSLTLFVVLCLLVSFIACSKYKDSPVPSNDLPEEKLVTTSIHGRVLDEAGVPVGDAVVSTGLKDTVTDVNGEFTLKDIKVSSRFGYVKVSAPGYFTGSRSIISEGGGVNNVSITLMARTAKGSFFSSAGGTVVVEAGDSVFFPANGLVTAATGADYNGKVTVYAAYLGPTDAALNKKMPGDLRGIDTSGKEVLMQTYGMMVVELEGSSGEKLQLASGKPATTVVRIPDTMLAKAPSTIPFWYFNDTSGRWIRFGTGTKKDKSYYASVSHFTWVNFDYIWYEAVNYQLRVVDEKGVAFADRRVLLSGTGVNGAIIFSAGIVGYTDNDGNLKGVLPKYGTYTLTVYNYCGEAAYGTQTPGPVISDQNFGTITVNREVAEISLTGKVVDCSGEPVKDGYVDVSFGYVYLRAAVVNGAFSTTFPKCTASSGTVKLTAADKIGKQVGAPVEVTMQKGAVDAGTLVACNGNTVNQYYKFSANGKSVNVIDPPDVFTFRNYSSYYRISANSTFDSYDINMDVQPVTSVGTVDVNWLDLRGNGVRFGANAGDVKFNVTSVGGIGEYITGTLSGTVTDSLSWPFSKYPVTGSVKVKRTQ